MYNNSINVYSFALALVYFKYTLTTLLSDSAAIIEIIKKIDLFYFYTNKTNKTNKTQKQIN